MLYVDVKYANLLGPLLRNYKKKDDYLWNFSCPVCNDSKKNKLKARGYIYRYKDGLNVKCHNCAYTATIRTFLKTLDPNLYAEYVREVYKETASSGSFSALPEKTQNRPPVAAKEPEEIVDTVLDHARRLDKLPPDHPAVQYVLGRQLPKYKKYLNRLVPGKFENLENDIPRLIIPYFNLHGAVDALQGRAFGKEEPRYITIKLNPESERIYGLERLDYSKRIYVVEGPLDSLCIPNAIAVSGSSFGSPTVEMLKANATLVFDNEPRNPDIMKLLKRAITKRFSVCIWPEEVTEKDINNLIESGKTADEIVEIIDNNTFSGAEAMLRFTKWRKC